MRRFSQRRKVSLHAFWKTHIQKTSLHYKRLLYIMRDSVGVWILGIPLEEHCIFLLIYLLTTFFWETFSS